jgi:hypothetical protein
VSNGGNDTILGTPTGPTSFIARSVPLSPGPNTLTATAVRRDGTSSSASVTVDMRQRLVVLTSPTKAATYEMPPSLTFQADTLLSSGTVQRVDYFRDQLRAIVGGASSAYAAISANPLGRGDEIRVLHISDLHLSTLGFDFAQELARGFDVDLVLDTGDITSFGTPAENVVTTFVPAFQRPYVFVRGSHDSASLQRAIARVPDAQVVDGDAVTVAGLTIYGLGDP